MTHQEIRLAFYAAAIAEREANTGEDGGTCNFDAAALILPGFREKTMNALVEDTGLRVYKMDRGRWNVHLKGPSGQANRHSRVAEAICKSLRESGLNIHMRYVAD